MTEILFKVTFSTITLTLTQIDVILVYYFLSSPCNKYTVMQNKILKRPFLLLTIVISILANVILYQINDANDFFIYVLRNRPIFTMELLSI